MTIQNFNLLLRAEVESWLQEYANAMASGGAKAQEDGSSRPLVLVLNASPATSFEEEVGNSPEALIALQEKVDFEALSQLLRIWWIPSAEEDDLTEIGLDDVAGLKRKYSSVQGLELFALCLSALMSDPASTLLQSDDDTEIDGDEPFDRPILAENLLTPEDAHAERAWEQVTREIASFGLPLVEDFREHISMKLDEERDNDLDGDDEKPSLMRAMLHVKSDAFQEQRALCQQIGTPQPDVAHPEQREVAEEIFRKAEQVLFGQIDADWTSKFNSVSFVVLTPNFNSLQSQTADRVTRAKLEGGRVLKHTKVPHAAMDAHQKWMKEEVKNPKTLFVIIADECHFAPTKDGAHDWLLNNPALNGENVLRLLVSATPQNVLSKASRVANSNIVRWFKPASMYRSMDYYVETATWAVPSYVRPLRLAVNRKIYDVDPRVTTHEGYAYRYPMHDYKAFCRVFNRRVQKELGSSLENELISVQSGKEHLLLVVPCDVDLDFDDNFDKKTGLLYWLGFGKDRIRIQTARQTAMGDGRKQYYRVGALGISLFCDTAEYNEVVDCLPRRRQRVLKDEAFDIVRGLANRSFGKRGAPKRKQKGIKVAESTPLYDGHIIMADYLLSLTYLAVYRVDHDNLWNRDLSRKDIFAPLGKNDVKGLALDDEKLKAFALHLGFADRVWPSVAHETEKEVGCFKIADGVEEPSVQYLLKILLEATVRSAWSELSNLDVAGWKTLTRRLNTEWVEEAKSLAIAENHDTPAHWRFAWQYVISEKLERNREDRTNLQGNTSQSWYNETDRLLHDLLDVHPKYRTGRMAVIRVYETDENLSIQDCLRSALKKLGLTSHDHGGLLSVVADVGGSDGKKKRTSEGKVVQKVARRATSLFTQLETWTLTRDLRHPSKQDVAATERETIVDRVNKSFAEAQAQDAEARKHLGEAPRSSPSKAVQKTAKYEDLENLPTIVILCEKGRMGDTFPHSFRFLDIRLRSSKTYSTFVQEFGRVCRYPGLDSSSAVTFEVSEEEEGWTALEQQLERFFKDPEVRRYFAKGGSYAVMDPGNEVRFHADSDLQLKSGFRTALRNVDDGRARFGRWTAKRYVHVLPTVLMNAERYNAQLQKAIEHKYHDAEGRQRIDQCIPGPLDLYLSSGPRRAAVASRPRVETIEEEKVVINPMHDIDAYRSRSAQTSRQIIHYDSGHSGGEDPRRLLLMAQCQQGKTGTYLHFLRLLKERVELAIPSPPNALPLVPRAEWTLPHWRNLIVSSQSPGFPALRSSYAMPKKGQYHHVQRQLWDAACRRGSMDQLEFGGADSFTRSMQAANAYESVAARSTSSSFTGKYHRKQYVVTDVKLADEGVCLSAPYAGFHGLNLKADGRNMQIKVGQRKLLNVSLSSEKRTMRTLDDATSVRWVFVPSYNRAGVALVDYEKAIPRDDSGKPTVVCIVVRSGKQFDDYVAAYGSAHLILGLPASMASKTSEGSRVFAERGGIGYARLFIQLAAHQLGLPWVWILDDNVDVCYERKLEEKVPVNALRARPDTCTFSTVMTGVESIVHNEDEELTQAHQQKRLEKWKPNGPVLRKKPAPEASHQNARTKEELTGGADQYGLIGIRRDPRARQTESEHPFMVTYSVYSFIYLNVTSTVNAGVFFPVKTFWEDIADGVEEASVHHLLKVLLEATMKEVWSELSNLDVAGWQTLTRRLNEEWVEEAKSLATAENHDTSAHWRFAWQYVISEKLERNREDRTASQGDTSQSWYNETDRLLHDLLDVDPKYRTGRMAVVRVYETDENLSIQDCLRSALKKLGLTSHKHGGLLSVVADVGGSDWKKRTSGGQEVQKVARRATSLFTQLEPWTLTRDLRHRPKQVDAEQVDEKEDDAKEDDAKQDDAKQDDAEQDDAKQDDSKQDDAKQDDAETERETIVDRVNKSFAEAQAQEAEARKHLGEASHSTPSKAVQKTAKYEDLENLPTIVILCGKWRVGDTFPHSFRFLDIRLRSSKTYSTFVQEFGRVCRYPGLDSNTAVTFKVSEEEEGWTALGQQLDDFFKDPEVRRYFAKGGSYAVLDPGQEVRFHADSEMQLKSWFQKARDKGDNGRARFGTWTVKRYVHVLPTVLMNAERYNAQLQKAIEHKYRDAEGLQRIDQCIPGPLDLYLSSGPRRAAAASRPRVESIEGKQVVINPMHDIDAYRSRSAQTSRQIIHYDSGHSGGDDPRRLLLMAQCQQGKTGAYLHFLRLLKERVELAIPTPADNAVLQEFADLAEALDHFGKLNGGLKPAPLWSKMMPTFFEQDKLWAAEFWNRISGEADVRPPHALLTCFLEVSRDDAYNRIVVRTAGELSNLLLVVRDEDIDIFSEIADADDGINLLDGNRQLKIYRKARVENPFPMQLFVVEAKADLPSSSLLEAPGGRSQTVTPVSPALNTKHSEGRKPHAPKGPPPGRIGKDSPAPKTRKPLMIRLHMSPNLE
ncbi:GREB1-like protein [Hondaea fermentalgiana]|uniref:GREB1-like protein n=1 Tax=Hondaea fermentalgiana TaxID=2315210 RepID=A0A2R5GLZ2_9STRA|nr:GREB1-like protein [Hondaea fermentalgiana]|eukprot:GBG30758.1 GREB1-like protein [Hondaea fermentalgiana]